MNRLIEIRAYKLKPGEGAAFHRIVTEQALPMLKEWGADVVAYGFSTHEQDAYFLIRAYEDLADLNARQDAFYGSEAWRNGPREAVIGKIESYLNTVLWLSELGVESIRQLNAGAAHGTRAAP